MPSTGIQARMKPSSTSLGSNRSAARSRAVQALYQWLLTNESIPTIRQQFMATQNMGKVDLDHFNALLTGIPASIAELRQVFSPFLDRPFEQIDPTEQAILLIGTYELMSCPSIPYRVIINEAIELAKSFGAEESHKYINSILDKSVTAIPLRFIEQKRNPYKRQTKTP